MFYDDDDEWEDEDEEITAQKITPILPPMATEIPDVDAASRALGSFDYNTETSEDVVDTSSELPEPEPVVADDPWGDIDHSSANELQSEPDIQTEETAPSEEIAPGDKNLENLSENDEQQKKKKRRPVKRRSKSSSSKK